MNRIPHLRWLLLILAVGILAGGLIAIRAKRVRVPATSTWRSLDLPVRDIAAEEYSIYSTIIDRLHAEDRLRAYVVRDHTLPCKRVYEWCQPGQLQNRMPRLQSETLNDYLVQNQQSVALSNSFNNQPPVALASDRDLSKMLIATKRQVDFDSLPSRKISWSLFYEQHQLTPGLISFSRVGFNASMDQAFVYTEIQANDNGTWGRYLALAKESAARSSGPAAGNGGWVISEKVESWMPEAPAPSIQQGELGTLKGRILDAKAEGLDRVELSVIVCGWNIGNLRTVLARDTLMLARVKDKKTFAGTYDLTTWYKFQIVDALSEKPLPKIPGYESPHPAPQEMQPIRDDEFVIPETNGQLEIDGVTVKQYSNGVNYKVGDTYLIFLNLSPATRVAFRSGTDPLGVFLVHKDGTFSPYLKEPYSLGDQMAKRFGNSTENLRNALKN
ncbi:MAG TPA: hypothetical protein VJU86_17315 [Pyrinomonadaceae bacterium]|nr:hypothetical protein [Pyrinomonadaceae bacterium]